MKHLKTLFIFAIFFVANSISAQSTFEKWPAIKDFHEVISQTFHPSEEGNLEPIKTRSEELAQKAELVVKSETPKEFKTAAIKAAAIQLQAKTKTLHELIASKKADDATITKSLIEIHDVFHDIVGLCSKEKH